VPRLPALAALLLAATLSAQTPPAPPADSAAIDSAAIDSAAIDSAAIDSAANASATADSTAPASASPLARLDSAALAPRGPFPPLDPSLAGVVWNAPDDAEAAVADLVAMRRAGVRAVRTGLIESTDVLAAASRLGIALWQDLPIEGLPAMFLRARTDEAARLLAEALDRARPYPAARHFGLAQSSDTSDPRTRPYFEALAALARERGAEGTRTYYVSRFPLDDRAARTVDIVLLDARDDDPVALLRRWRAARDTPVGLASMGTGVRPGQPGGWRTLGTEAAQARTLENAFTDLLGLSEPPAAAFVYRWRDADADRVQRDQRAEVTGTRFGLLGEDDEPRPALDVASGFWTGRQRVFAFDAGSEARQERRASPLLLVGWGLVLGLGVFYAGAPRLGSMAPRYFGRRDLYRESIQRGFDLSAFETSGLALALTLAAGVVGTSVLRALARTDALVAATSSWSLDGQARLTSLLGQPLLLVGVLALAYGAWLLLNLIWLNVITGRRRIRPAQALSLAVWCRWGWLPLMILSLLLGSIDPHLATVLAPTVLGVGLLLEVVAGYKMMWDLQAVKHVPPARAILLGYGLPFLLAVGVLVALGFSSRDEIGFLWHLATRS
jgi:hypothetical protein